ncbi:hypothetical protein QQZ08_005493 [Neonectria magnoliae]|uniref:Glucose-methanol-choline oxidoreductase N-terminal domain-containing protein n=1 Tax=Neonectria magnoliae TaxID=2732573 RepID=A0ABR1I3X7_9HYPO
MNFKSLALGIAYIDPDTNITFQKFTDTASSFSFGIALPSNPTADFIGQISAPITDGYAGLSLTTSMAKSLLIVAWPNGESVVSSLRKATGYANPDVLDDDTVSLKTIASGTSVNDTAFTYTFLCEGCIKGDSTTFAATDDSPAIGWALSTTALDNPSAAGGALNYHSAGFGGFAIDLASAKSADYATWAALASDDTSTTPDTGSGSGSTPKNITTTISNVTYDYIVAGAGAAGLIVAERLAESNASVLLLERGKASFFSTGGQSIVDWNDTVTQYDVPGLAYALSTAADTTGYCTDTASQAGCILGGSTAINAMMFVKPQSSDFDRKWPTGWKWADGVKEAASRLYERTPGTTTPSKDGELKWLDGYGFSEVDAIDQPEEKRKIYSHPPTMISNGLRAGPVRDYLPLAQALPKFDLKLNAKMLRVVRNGSSISGVEVETGVATRQIIKLNAKGAVILASGALSTPRILFNSGIGPTDQIRTVSNGSTHITLPASADWIDLPVGQNLQDHPIFTVELKTKESLSSLSSTAFTAPNQTNVDMFAQGSGLLAQSGQRLTFWTSVSNTTDGVERFVQGTCNSPSNDTVRIKVYLTHGLSSTGTLGITSSGATKITKEPYLNTSADKEAILSFMRQLIAYASKSDSALTIASNTTAESLIALYVTGSHFVGTARMGTSQDGNSVVDVNTKVWGTENLFVVDASIHPDLPTGNTQAIVMVAAEHAAQKILKRDQSSSTTPTTTTPSAVTTPSSATTPATSTKPASSKCRLARRRSSMFA